MNTVYKFMHVFCEERKLPPPTPTHITECGAWISREFRIWLFNREFTPGVVVPDTGLMVQKEGEKSFVVALYPADFKSEMARVCTRYYHFINEPKKPQKPPPSNAQKKRKRIPLGAEKVGSSNYKSNPGQTSGHH